MPNFVIFGRRGAGKDEVTRILKENIEAEQLALSKYVRRACEAFGIDNPTKTDLVFIGTEIGRKMIDENIWNNMGKKEVLANPHKNYIISDARFPNEYELYVGELKFFPIFVDTEFDTCVERVIKRDGSIDMSLLDHPSENNYKKFVGYRIDNNRTIEELEQQIKDLLWMISVEDIRNKLIEKYWSEYRE